MINTHFIQLSNKWPTTDAKSIRNGQKLGRPWIKKMRLLLPQILKDKPLTDSHGQPVGKGATNNRLKSPQNACVTTCLKSGTAGFEHGRKTGLGSGN